ncbi:hypothetical protein ACTWPT_33785 [Nonomuraea sp. 3N208]|uniref:hypothetical protein n=1 Tax=Nonomuraea sp. 3N208 TaxID=3457421 RepID=UPI003FD4EA83
MLSALGGWRTIYWPNAILVAVVAVLLWRFLPRLHTPIGLSYPALLRSTLAMFRHERLLRWRIAGRLADRGWVQWVSGIGTAVLALSWPMIGAGAVSLGCLVAGTAFFLGGAAGSLLTSVAWTGAGWTGVSLLGGTLSTATFVLWALERVRAKRS